MWSTLSRTASTPSTVLPASLVEDLQVGTGVHVITSFADPDTTLGVGCPCGGHSNYHDPCFDATTLLAHLS
jgi:hypothetical protein